MILGDGAAWIQKRRRTWKEPLHVTDGFHVVKYLQADSRTERSNASDALLANDREQFCREKLNRRYGTVRIERKRFEVSNIS